jgi:kinesin family protein 1
MHDRSTTVVDPNGKLKPHTFSFDHSFWSGNAEDPTFASQERVYESIGRELLRNAFEGFNGCLFAYGQTGSGKTYTMTGYGDDRGIIPRLCFELFDQGAAKSAASDGLWEFHVEVSYLEIYNERCRCLLAPPNAKREYRVREHPVTGPYVDNLTKLMVHSFDEIERIMDEGNKSRTVASTNMNATSSRSHALFTLELLQQTTHKALGAKTEVASRLILVDLAGSERADRTGATGKTLKEGSNINQSLTSLGKVITALADGAGKDSSLGGVPPPAPTASWGLTGLGIWRSPRAGIS